MSTQLYKKHLKRLRIVLLGIFFLVSISAMRTFYIQLIRGTDKDIIEKRLVSGKRGIIYDRNGKKIAYDIQTADIFLDNSNAENLNSYEISLFMNENFGLDIENTKSLIDNSSGFLMLLRNVDQNKIDNIMPQIRQIPNILISPKRNGRYYPQNNLAAQLIGNFREGNSGWGVETYMNNFLKPKQDSLDYFVLSNGARIPAFSNEDHKKIIR